MKSKPTNIPESELVRNIIFLGTTGAGKSTTCNTLYGNPNGPFITSHDQVSGSESVVDKVSESKRIRLFDTPGFGDSGFDEREIDRMLRSLTSIFTDTRVDSTKQVDAFVLVVKLDPRAHSLKRDLERIKNLFGTSALRSLVLLLIYDVKDGKARGKDFLHKLNKMEEVKRILKEGKHSEPSEDWFCVWDNLNPIPGQEEALFGKMKKLQPYTYSDFLESEKEVKHRIDSEMGSQLQREIEKVRGQYETNIELQRKQMQEFQERFEREKKELIEMRENAIANTAKIIAAINEISERTQSILSKLHGQIETEKEESAKKFLEIGQNKANPYSKQLEDYLKEHREMLRRFEASVEKKVENTTGAAAEVAVTTEEAQEPKTLTTIFMELLGKKDEAGKQEKTKELLGATAKKGAETVAKKGAQEVATKGIVGLAKKACNMF